MQNQIVKSMTGRERVLAALNNEPTDRTPICNPTSVATVELMDLVDAPFPQANREPELMARRSLRQDIPSSGSIPSCPFSPLSKNRARSVVKFSGNKRTIGPQL